MEMEKTRTLFSVFLVNLGALGGSFFTSPQENQGSCNCLGQMQVGREVPARRGIILVGSRLGNRCALRRGEESPGFAEQDAG